MLITDPANNLLISKILTSLGFGVDLSGDSISIKVPSFRATKDITLAVDIVEEDADESAEESAESEPTEEKYYCPDCGAEITLDMTHCPKCGVEFEFTEDEE